MVTAEMDSMDETPRPEPGRTRTHRFPRDPRSPRAATPPPSQPSRRPDVRNSPRPGGAAANTLTLDIRPVPPYLARGPWAMLGAWEVRRCRYGSWPPVTSMAWGVLPPARSGAWTS